MKGQETLRRRYSVSRIKTVPVDFGSLPMAVLDIFPWADPAGKDYRPGSSAKMAAGDTGLYVWMETDETGVRAEEQGFSNQVYTDSCMELFLMPDPAHSPRYLNWEFNPRGAMYLSLGTSRYDREDIRADNYRDLFQVKTEVHSGLWRLEYYISLDFLRSFFPSMEWGTGHAMRGNFYKCGDKTAHPHFGCWSPIELPQPDFHCPDFFGDLVLD